MLSGQTKQRVETRFQMMLPLLKEKKEEILSGLRPCKEEEAEAIKFLYANMPLSDIANYPFDVFLDYAKHGVFLWNEVINREVISEELFLYYILYARVNSEDLSPCRSFFYNQIKDSIVGLSTEEAILQVNYWCLGEATYQSTDDRTASPITTFQSGYGRCGEESTFTVSALRSVGIPARQVYAPRWSHCDDNHAWVEVWYNGTWHFLGACEPEEVINQGWFTNASSRAMLIHSRIMAQGETKEILSELSFLSDNFIERDGVAIVSNELSRYAKTKKFTIVVQKNGLEKVEGAKIRIQVLNYCELATIATIITDLDGKAQLTLGLGTIIVQVSKGQQSTQAIVNTTIEDTITIHLDQKEEEGIWIPFDVVAPTDFPIHTNQPTLEQKETGKQKTEQYTKHRLEKVACFYSEQLVEDWLQSSDLNWLQEQKEVVLNIIKLSAGNRKEIQTFLQTKSSDEHNCYKLKLLDALSKKDYRDCKATILSSHLNYVIPYKDKYEAQIFIPYLLNPRISLEVLTPYCEYIRDYFSMEQIEIFSHNPIEIWNWIEATIEEKQELEYNTLLTTPEGCLTIQIANKSSKKVLFVAICRSIGIPARLNKIDDTIQYYQNGMFYSVEERTKEKAILHLCIKVEENTQVTWNYGENFSIAKKRKGDYNTLHFENSVSISNGNQFNFTLDPGKYRVLTSNRLPNGTIFACEYYVSLKEKEEKEIPLKLREAQLSDMLEQIQLPQFILYTEEQEQKKASELTGQNTALFLWLEESKEPTEHILNELYERKEEFLALQTQLIFVVHNKEALQDPTLQKTRFALPNSLVLYDDFSENISLLARRMYVDPDKLPLILVVEKGNIGIYATSGYNVGTAHMLLRILNQ